MRKVHELLKPFYIFGVILALWWIAASLEIWNTYLLPPPWKVANTFVTMLRRGEITGSIIVSGKRVLTGAAISFALAFSGGVCSAYLPSKSEYWRHLSNFMRNVPPISLISLLILWFGIGETSKLIVIVLASVFPMYLNISKGFRECDKKLMEVGQTMGFSKITIFFKICLPYAREDILVGLRTLLLAGSDRCGDVRRRQRPGLYHRLRPADVEV